MLRSGFSSFVLSPPFRAKFDHLWPPESCVTKWCPAAMSSPVPLTVEMFQSAQRGELQKVVKWLRKGGLADSLCSSTAAGRRTSTFGLLHAAASNGQLEMVRMLLKRGASVDLPSGLGRTALMEAAHRGHLPILRFLLQRSTNPNLQDSDGSTTLMHAAYKGQEACVQALLHANANPELLDNKGRTAPCGIPKQGGSKLLQTLSGSTHTSFSAAVAPCALRCRSPSPGRCSRWCSA